MQDLIKDIEKLEAISKKLEPGTELLKDWNQKVNAYGLEFVQGLDAGKAYEQYDGQELDFLDFGPEGDSIDNALEKIKSTVDHFGINPASGGHLGYIPGGGLYSSAIGDYLAAVYCVSDVTSRIFVDHVALFCG